MPPGQRKCTRCLEWWPPSGFARSRHGRDGLDPQCRECHREIRCEVAARLAETPRPLPPSKLCRRCGETKPLAAFNRSPQCRDGRSSPCRACTLETRHRWLAANQKAVERIRASAARYRAKPETKEKRQRWEKETEAGRAWYARKCAASKARATGRPRAGPDHPWRRAMERDYLKRAARKAKERSP
jgi:hypothetical protein